MSDLVAHTMRELLERMAASLITQQPPPPLAQPPAGDVASPSTPSSYLAPFSNQSSNEDRLLGSLSTLLDIQLQALEDRAVNPLKTLMKQLEERCGRLEALLREQSGTKTVTVDLQQAGKEAPPLVLMPGTYPTKQQPATPDPTPFGRKGEKLTRREKEQATELLSQLDLIAPTAANHDAWLST